jgi:hypothetical protein
LFFQLTLVVSRIITSQIISEHHAGKLLGSRDSRLRHGGLSHENNPYRNSFLLATNRNNNHWRRRQKAGEFGNYQGSRLLFTLSAALP